MVPNGFTPSAVAGRCFGTAADAWVRFVVPADGWFRVSTHPSDGGTANFGAYTHFVEVFSVAGGVPVPLVCGHVAYGEDYFDCCDEVTPSCCEWRRSAYSRATAYVTAGTTLLVSFGGTFSAVPGTPPAFVGPMLDMVDPVANDVPAGAFPVGVGFDHRAVVERTVIETPSAGCPALGTADVWFRFTAPADGHLLVSTLKVDDGSALGGFPGPTRRSHAAIWDAATYPAGGPSGCGSVDWSTSYLNETFRASRAAAPVAAGADYYVQISTIDGVVGGQVDFDVEFLPAPYVPFRRAFAPTLGVPSPFAYAATVGRVTRAGADLAASQAGGPLLTLKNGPEGTPFRDDGSTWLGLSRPSGGGPFVAWEDGTPLGYQHWAPGEPNASPTADRVVVDGYTGFWRAVPSSERHYATVLVPTARTASAATVPGTACPDDGTWHLSADDPWMGGTRAGFTVAYDANTAFDALAFVYFSPAPVAPWPAGPCFAFVDPSDVVLVTWFVRFASPTNPSAYRFLIPVPRVDPVVGLLFRLQTLELPLTGGFRLSNAVDLRFGF
jgi:hypothetical protein